MREQIGPYTVERALGRGGMGVVYAGVHHSLNRRVAIKALAPELTRDPAFRERFFSEARTQAQLQHSNIVTIYDLLEDDEEFFIVMEYVEGRGLDEMLDALAGHGMPLAQALAIFHQVLAALAAAHVAGVIHRDVKPSNVLITDQGTVKLMDFGIALLVGDLRLTASSQTIGTPVYMSPEQILRPRDVDHRTDLYSAAVMLYEMLAGRPPFDGETEFAVKKLHIETAVPDLAEHLPSLEPRVAQALRTALAKAPDDRFARAEDFARALASGDAAAAAMQTTVMMPSPAASRSHRDASGTQPSASTRGRAQIVGLTVGLLALIALGVGLFTRMGAPAPPASEATVRPTRAVAPVAVRPASFDAQPADWLPAVLPIASPDARRSAEAAAARRASAAAQRARQIDALRQTIAAAPPEIDRLIASAAFTAASDRVQVLQQQAETFADELVDERITLGVLAQRIADSERERGHRLRAVIELQLGEIRTLLDASKFPEAKSLAERLADDPETPNDLRTQAHTLLAEAKRGLQARFAEAKRDL